MKVNPLLLMVIPLLFLSGPYVNAGPVETSSRKLVTRFPSLYSPSLRLRLSRRALSLRRRRRPRGDGLREQNLRPPQRRLQSDNHHTLPKEEGLTGSVRPVSAADIEKAKAGLPYGIPVPGRKGMVTSPYLPEEDKYIDVTGFASGSVVKDPYTGKFLLVP